MIICTSLSPFHSNKAIQAECVRSWQKLAFVYSLNTQKEIELIENEYFGVCFVKTHRTSETLFGRPLISINAIFDFAIENEQDLFMINSDIYVDSLPPLHTDGITIFSRWDYEDHFGQGKLFLHGFDGFFFPKHLLKLYPPTIYALGGCYFDHSIPLRYIQMNVPVYWPQGKHLFHKLHKTQYSIDEWLWLADFFRFEFKMPKHLSAGEIATQNIKIINHKAIKQYD